MGLGFLMCITVLVGKGWWGLWFGYHKLLDLGVKVFEMSGS